MKILHISDLHIAAAPVNPQYSIEQMKSVQEVYEKQADSIDRVLVTGDLSADGNKDQGQRSIHRAFTWLTDKISDLRPMDETGLNIKDRNKLKILPGNRDYNFQIPGNSFEDKLKKGLSAYNNAVSYGSTLPTENPHFSIPGRFFSYDWLEPKDSDSIGIFILYANTAPLGKDREDFKQDKLEFIDFLCTEINEQIIKPGLAGNLKHPNKKINGADFKASFKIIATHHSFHKENKASEFIHSKAKEKLLTNLLLMDFQLQLSGHGHISGTHNDPFEKLFDDRAAERYILNHLKMLFGIENNFSILKDRDGKRRPRVFTFFQEFASAFANLQKRNNSDINNIEKLIDELILLDEDDLIDQLKEMILKKEQGLVSAEDFKKIKKSLSETSRSKAIQITNQAEKLLKRIKLISRKREYFNINAGSISISSKKDYISHFNIYYIEEIGGEATITCEEYDWMSDLRQYKVVSRRFITFNKDKVLKSNRKEIINHNA